MSESKFKTLRHVAMVRKRFRLLVKRRKTYGVLRKVLISILLRLRRAGLKTNAPINCGCGSDFKVDEKKVFSHFCIECPSCGVEGISENRFILYIEEHIHAFGKLPYPENLIYPILLNY